MTLLESELSIWPTLGHPKLRLDIPPQDPKKGGSDSAIKPLKPQFSYLNGSTRVWLKAEYHTFGGYNSLFDPLWGTSGLDWISPHYVLKSGGFTEL
jgi:hypothetical protein